MLDASGFDLTNYTVTYDKGNMDISKAALTFVVDNKTKTYGDVNPTLTGSFDSAGFKNSDSITVDSTTGAVSAVSLNSNGTTVEALSAASGLVYDGSAITSTSKPGVHTDVLGASGFDLTNYTVNYDKGNMEVTNLPIPAEPPYQTAVRLPYTWGGQRTVQDTSSILFLRVISNGINVGGDRLIADDILKYEI